MLAILDVAHDVGAQAEVQPDRPAGQPQPAVIFSHSSTPAVELDIAHGDGGHALAALLRGGLALGPIELKLEVEGDFGG